MKQATQQMLRLIVTDPVFGEKICEVPIKDIVHHYDPIKKLRMLRSAKNLQPLEQKVVALAEELKEAAGIPWSSMGISGSVMAKLFTLQSDIDPLVYGSENCRKAYPALQTLLKEKKSNFKRYTKSELQTLFDFRSKDTIMSFENFEQVEKRKAFQGKYDGTDYFIRFVKDYDEVKEQYGDVCYKWAGDSKISATVIDDSEALFTPCTYKIDNVKVIDGTKVDSIAEIVSFRGRFCEQAKPGEKVEVQGKVECVTDKRVSTEHRRIIIGNKPSDYMTLLKA